MIVTPELVMSWAPCPTFTIEEVKELVGEGGPHLEVFDEVRGKVQDGDLFWVALKGLPREDWPMLGTAFAESVMGLADTPLASVAIRIARLCAFGEAKEAPLKAVRSKLLNYLRANPDLPSETHEAIQAAVGCTEPEPWTGVYHAWVHALMTQKVTTDELLDIVRLYGVAMAEAEAEQQTKKE